MSPTLAPRVQVSDPMAFTRSARQAGPEAEEDRAHSPGEDRVVSDERHGEQEEVANQQPVGPHPERAGPAQDGGSEEAGGGQR